MVLLEYFPTTLCRGWDSNSCKQSCTIPRPSEGCSTDRATALRQLLDRSTISKNYPKQWSFSFFTLTSVQHVLEMLRPLHRDVPFRGLDRVPPGLRLDDGKRVEEESLSQLPPAEGRLIDPDVQDLVRLVALELVVISDHVVMGPCQPWRRVASHVGIKVPRCLSWVSFLSVPLGTTKVKKRPLAVFRTNSSKNTHYQLDISNLMTALHLPLTNLL